MSELLVGEQCEAGGGNGNELCLIVTRCTL